MNTIQLTKASGPDAPKESIDSKMLHKMGNDFINMKNEIIAENSYKIYGNAGEVKEVPLNIFKTTTGTVGRFYCDGTNDFEMLKHFSG